MATILLSAVGAAAGASIGGGVLGLSSVVIGRAVGASLGRAIDQRLLGAGSAAVESGQVDRFRLSGASEGAAVAQVYGRIRVAGQVIWVSRFLEKRSTSGGGGKGAPSQPKVTQYSYSVSLAIALCEGEITRVGRIWADGAEIARDDISMRVYSGSADQMPDAKMEAVEGAGNVPAYRGTTYVVIEDLALAPFGNRVPQFSFEVMRPEQPGSTDGIARSVKAVAMIPGTGEYALATTPVNYQDAPGQMRSANINSPSGKTDFTTSLEALVEEMPGCGSVSLVVAWFGDDLRVGQCQLRPGVEQNTVDGDAMPWSVSGATRAAAYVLPQVEGRSVYGGTPTDASVIEAITALQAAGQQVMFYPFVLMDQLAGNALPDPWGGTEQAALPWRGRITTGIAPGLAGSSDGTTAAAAEVAAFFGAAEVADFTIGTNAVGYSGPAEWSLRRMILHYAHLCALAGGVEAFCIGSELRGVSRIQDDTGFPAVAELVRLAADVRSVLGPECKISYAADWSEYAGYQSGGDLLFPLDDLWADANVDFIGIDNYMPLSDWREGEVHADASFGSVYNLDYLTGNVAGGGGYEWYYTHEAHREAQIRTPITDGAWNEPWVWRVKDIRAWWENEHHERIGDVRQEAATAWVAASKPVWFTEMGCAAVDKGTNQPNKFLDPKSSESALPYYSDGRRDDFIQMQYLRAMAGYWNDTANNPVSASYGGAMVDMGRAHVWSWDARPFPHFPANTELWGDGANYQRGHWLNGRASARALSDVVREICARSGVTDVDVSRLYGLVRGYQVDQVGDARSALQPLMLAYGFDAVEREGVLAFQSRDGLANGVIGFDALALSEAMDSHMQRARVPAAEIAGRVRLNYVEAEGNFSLRSQEAVFPDQVSYGVSQSEVPLVLTATEGRQIVERWLAESRIARDTVQFALPLSGLGFGAGDVVELEEGGVSARYRLDRVIQTGSQLIEAVRVEPGVYWPSDSVIAGEAQLDGFVAPVPVLPLFLDLPLLRGDEVPHAPHVAATASPWPGSVAVYGSASDSGYTLNRLLPGAAAMGICETALVAGPAGVWDRGGLLRVKMLSGDLASVDAAEVLNGANAAALGSGNSTDWEIIQFRDATLVGSKTWELSTLLRGQAGSDALALDHAPGAWFVLLDGVPEQIEMALSVRGLSRHYRIGPAGRSYDDPSYLHRDEAFDGIGLRPLSPVHLRAAWAGSDIAFSWVRRSRVDGDSWASLEVPLGESSEAYLLRVRLGAAVLREEVVSQPVWTYTAAARSADGVTGNTFTVEVAQLSEAFGPGLFRGIEIDG
jgi:Gene Transfer Agent (GTA)-like protein/putative tail protein